MKFLGKHFYPIRNELLCLLIYNILYIIILSITQKTISIIKIIPKEDCAVWFVFYIYTILIHICMYMYAEKIQWKKNQREA